MRLPNPAFRLAPSIHGTRENKRAHLRNNIPNLILHLLLSPGKPLPQIITHTTPLQKHSQSLFLAPQRQHPVNILRRASQKCSLEHRLRYRSLFLTVVFGGLVEVQEGEIDVALEVRGEPWFEGGGFFCWSVS